MIGGISMIIYNKLNDYLKANKMKWIDLQNAIGVSPSVLARLQKNRPCNTDTVDKVCAFLRVQPGDIMEWVENENEAEILSLQRQKEELEAKIAELQAKE